MAETPMVEKVGRAIVASIRAQGGMASLLFEGHEDGPVFEDKMPTTVDGDIDLMAVARAAIVSMRMMHLPGDSMDIINAKRAWNAGIDAVLAAPDEGGGT